MRRELEARAPDVHPRALSFPAGRSTAHYMGARDLADDGSPLKVPIRLGRRGRRKARTMTRRKKIYEGKAKILYEGPEPGTLVAHFKDDATAFNNQKRGTLEGKGVLNN